MSGSSTRPQYKRSLRNYLLDSRFQLKYTGLMLVMALAIASFLGVFLWRTSHAVVVEAQKVAAESKKVSDVVRMGMAKDPVYGDNPELLAAFNEDAINADKAVESQQQSLIVGQRNMIRSLIVALGVMVVAIGLLGIYFTHKVAGPIYKMKSLLRQVGEGRLAFGGRLRKGDELQDFFEEFMRMVDKLKDRQRQELEQLERALELAKSGGAPDPSLKKIAVIRDQMKKALDE